ncbi:homeobox protein cut-like [Diaphorina citri]|uniref:Homeobox protein cut-like n=1 Tax=Diaphorina citri TaxID=121845 RepID=A0A1S3DHG6_DIACI|nr:homeobox protein cut-like [Diaphorina citri]
MINNYVNKKLKQLEDQNFKHDSLVPNLYESNFEQVYLHEDLNVESNEELKTNSETCRVIHQKDVNFNSSQYSCSISEDTVLNPLNETNVDLEESTESFASSEWNMSSDNSVPNYLSYYEYSHTVEYCTTLKLSTINDSSISMSHVPEKNISFSSASNDTSNVKVAAEESQDTRSGIESNRVHNIQYCLYSPNQNDPSKTNNINKIQANYNPKTHATIIHLAKSSMLDKNRNDSTVNSQSMCSSKKNIVRKHKNSSTSDVEDNHKMLPADKESLFNLPDLKSSDLVQVDKNLSVPDNFPNIFLCDENDKIVQSDEFINTAALLGTDDKLFEESSSSEVSCNENLNQLIASLSDDTNSCDANTKKKKKKSEKSVSSTRCKQDYVSGAVIKVNECRSESNNSNSWNDKTNVPENGYNIDKNTNSRLQFDIELGIEMMDNSELRIIKSSVKSKSSNITENSSNNNMEKNIKTEVELENTQSYFPAGDVKQPLFHHREQNYQQDQLHDCQEQHYNEKQGQYHHEHLSHRQQPKQQQQHIQNHQLFDHRHQKTCENMLVESNMSNVNSVIIQQDPAQNSLFHYYEPFTNTNVVKTRSDVLDIPILPANRMMSIAEVLANPDCNPELQFKLKTISSSKVNK